MMNTVNTEFSHIEVWFTDQASKALEIEDCQCDTNYWVVIIKMRYSTEPRFRKHVKGYTIVDKTTSIGKPKEKEKTKEIEEIYIPPEKRQQIIDDLRLF